MLNKIRQKENLHIYFWLIKDLFWSLEFRLGGMLMIIPTVSLAFYILYLSRENTTEKIHNTAVCLWIIANALWMTGEFFTYDFRLYSAILFSAGITIISFYYIKIYFLKNNLQL